MKRAIPFTPPLKGLHPVGSLFQHPAKVSRPTCSKVYALLALRRAVWARNLIPLPADQPEVDLVKLNFNVGNHVQGVLKPIVALFADHQPTNILTLPMT